MNFRDLELSTGHPAAGLRKRRHGKPQATFSTSHSRRTAGARSTGGAPGRPRGASALRRSPDRTPLPALGGRRGRADALCGHFRRPMARAGALGRPGAASARARPPYRLERRAAAHPAAAADQQYPAAHPARVPLSQPDQPLYEADAGALEPGLAGPLASSDRLGGNLCRRATLPGDRLQGERLDETRADCRLWAPRRWGGAGLLPRARPAKAAVGEGTEKRSLPEIARGHAAGALGGGGGAGRAALPGAGAADSQPARASARSAGVPPPPIAGLSA